MTASKEKCFLSEEVIASLANASKISLANAKELIRLYREEYSKGCTFKGGIKFSVAKRMIAEHPKEKDLESHMKFVSAVLKEGKRLKQQSDSQPEKQIVVIEDTSKLIQLELFAYQSPWFRPYMDQP